MHTALAAVPSPVLLESLGPQHARNLVACARQLAHRGEMGHWATSTYDDEAAGRYITRAQSKRAAVRGEVFAVVSAGSLVGCGALEDVDWIHGSASAWLWISPEARGHGRGIRALEALQRIAVTRGITRVECLLPADDLKGLEWAKKRGCVVEGVLRGRYLLQEGRVDGVLLGLLFRP